MRRVAVRRAKERVDDRAHRRAGVFEVRVETVAAPSVLETRALGSVAIRFNGFVDGVLFDVREKVNGRAERTGGAGAGVGAPKFARADFRARGRESVVRVVIVLDGQPELLQVVRALHAAGGFASGLNRREKQTDQNADDRDNDQQLDEGETKLFALSGHTTFLN